MRLTPLDVSQKEFAKVFLGYSPLEVMNFLEEIADQLEQMAQERNKLKEDLRDKDIEILNYKEKEELLKNTIATAGQMAEKIQKDAVREARLIIQDAEQKAELIGRDARDNLKNIYKEISDLKRLRMQFESSLKAMAHAHLTLIEQSETMITGIDDPESTALMQKNQNLNTVNNKISPLSAQA